MTSSPFHSSEERLKITPLGRDPQPSAAMAPGRLVGRWGSTIGQFDLVQSCRLDCINVRTLFYLPNNPCSPPKVLRHEKVASFLS